MPVYTEYLQEVGSAGRMAHAVGPDSPDDAMKLFPVLERVRTIASKIRVVGPAPLWDQTLIIEQAILELAELPSDAPQRAVARALDNLRGAIEDFAAQDRKAISID